MDLGEARGRPGAPKDDGRATVAISHARLSAPEEVEHWKAFWGDWLAALED